MGISTRIVSRETMRCARGAIEIHDMSAIELTAREQVQ